MAIRMCSYTVTEPAMLTAMCSGANVSCNGGNNGSASVTAGGGTSPYIYLWSNASTDASITGLSAGTYTVTVTDANSCIATCSYTVTEPAILTATCSGINVSCNGGNNGSASVTAGGGTSPYTYLWSNASTDASITGLSAGTYTVTVTDVNSCIATCSYTVTEPVILTATCSGTNVACNGGNTGSVSVTAADGTSPYTYLWSNASTDASITGLAAGTYNVTVTDANSCISTCSYTVTEPVILTATCSGTNVACNGGNTGSVSVTAADGTSPYTYLWSNASTDASITGLAAGTYNVTVTDANSCISTCSYTVTEPVILSATCSGTNVSCSGGSDGSASVSALGGTSPYAYAWSNSATDASITGLIAGSYTVTVTDANGCTAACSYTVTEPASALVVSCYSEPAFCFGGNSFIDISVTGGTAMYTYLWSNGVTDEDQPSIGAGTYTVTVTDANGCTATCSTEITEPTEILVTATVDSATCAGDANGAIQINTAGGTPCANNSRGLLISKYFANPSGNDAAQEFVELIATRNIDFSVTPYTVIVANNGTATNLGWKRGSTITYAFQITSGTAVQGGVYYVGGTQMSNSGITSNILRSINITNTGGDGGLGNLQATAGVFGNGGSSADGIAIFQGTVATITPTVQPIDAIFYGTAIGSAMVSSGTAGYMLPVNDKYAGGFLDSSKFFALDPVSAQYTVATGTFNPILDAFTANRTFANSASFTPGNSNVLLVGASDPYTYVWSTGATTQNISGLNPGIYTVTVTDCNGCTKSQEFTVHSKLILNGTVAGTNLTCNGNGTGAVDLMITNGTPAFTYTWSNGATTEDISGVAAGTYTVMAADINGCSLTAMVTLSEPTTITLSGTVSDVLCNGDTTGAITLSPSGGTPCGENAPGLVISKIFPNPNGNDSPFEFVELVAVKDIDFSVTPYSVVFANNGNANANGWIQGGGVTYGFDINSGTATAGSVYYVGGSSMVPVSNRLRHINTATTAGDNGLGLANATGVLGNGGTSADAVAVFNQPLSALTPSTVPADALFFGSVIGGAALPGGTTGYQLPVNDHYSGGKLQSVAFLALDSKTDTVIQASGTYSLLTSTFTTPRTFTYANIASFAPGVSGVSITMANAYLYSWSNGTTNQNATGLSAGTYTVTVTDCNGCINTGSFTVNEPALLTASCSGMDITCFGANDGTASVTASGGVLNYTYSWSNGDTNSSITGLSAGNYCVTVTDANGCTASCCYLVAEPALVQISLTPTNVTCLGGSDGAINATVTGGTPVYTYLWSNAQTDAMASGLMSGTYTVTVTDANGCTATASATITHTLAIPAMPGAVTGPTLVCRNTTQSYSVAAVPGASTYTWTAPAGATVTGGQGTTNATIFYSNSAVTGNVTVTAGNVCGTSGPRSVLVTVVPNKPAMPTISGLQNGVCGRKNLVYTCSVVAGATSYTWTVPTGGTLVSGQGTNSITVHFGNTFTGSGFITVKANNICGSSNVRSYFVGGKLPTPVISGLNWTCPDSIRTYTIAPITGATSYTWTVVPGSTLISGQGTTSITVKWGYINGVIKVKANSVSVCSGSSTAQKPVSFTCTREGNEQFGSLGVYPNPTDNFTIVDFDAFETSEGTLQVYNMLGSLVYDRAISVAEGRNRLELNVQSFAPGTYLIRVSAKGFSRVERLVVD
ncbi:MAG: T9SS type A sorting domain-containing protein [Bacteroidetes bacterium]|nr:T9SS type A sorting domain-containing protein [Bacteroidota bacterium]